MLRAALLLAPLLCVPTGLSAEDKPLTAEQKARVAELKKQIAQHKDELAKLEGQLFALEGKEKILGTWVVAEEVYVEKPGQARRFDGFSFRKDGGTLTLSAGSDKGGKSLVVDFDYTLDLTKTPARLAIKPPPGPVPPCTYTSAPSSA